MFTHYFHEYSHDIAGRVISRTATINTKTMLVLNDLYHYALIADGKFSIHKFPEVAVAFTTHFDHFVIFSGNSRIYKSYDGENWELLLINDGGYHHIENSKYGFGNKAIEVDIDRFAAQPSDECFISRAYRFNSFLNKEFRIGRNGTSRDIYTTSLSPNSTTEIVCENPRSENKDPFMFNGDIFAIGHRIMRFTDGKWVEFEPYVERFDGTIENFDIREITNIFSSEDSNRIFIVNRFNRVFVGVDEKFYQANELFDAIWSPHRVMSKNKLFLYNIGISASVKEVDMTKYLNNSR